MQNWGNLLVPEGGFHHSDLWEVLIVVILLWLCTRIFGKKYKISDTDNITPKDWLKQNLGFITQWFALLVIYLAFKFLIKLEVPVIRFFTYIGGAWILIGLTSSLLKKRFWAQPVAAVAYIISGFFGLALVEDSIALLSG